MVRRHRLWIGLAAVLGLVCYVALPRIVPSRPADRSELVRIAATVQAENGHNNTSRVRQLQASLLTALPVAQETYLRQTLAWELLIAGNTQAAIDEYQRTTRALTNEGSTSSLHVRDKLHLNLGVAFMRLAEQENCIAQHCIDSCLLPIRAGSAGVHADRHGATEAVREFSTLLESDPNDLAARWLLNVAHMTLGQYPDQVRAQWLIPPEIFNSEFDLPRFYDVAPLRGLDVVGLSGGVVTEDFDRDGWLDIMVSSMGFTDQLRLFHNERNGSFTDWTERAGLTGIVGGLNLCHADFENDGDCDVLVLRGGWLKSEGRQPRTLLRNRGDGTFEDVTRSAGLRSYLPTQTASWADFDGDGWLDLFIGNETAPPLPSPCELYHNNRDGTFSDCAIALGVAVTGVVKGVTWGDYNNDGRPDLYVSRYGQPNLLFRNDGPVGAAAVPVRAATPNATRRWWQFTEVAQSAGVADPVWSFPTWFWDYDNDGWLDLMVLGFAWHKGVLGDIAADYLSLPNSGPLPRLYRNRRDGTFEDVTAPVRLNRVLLSMGSNFGDLDNDGFLDFYVGTGDPDLRTLIPNRMFRNDGGSVFQDVTTAGGFGHLQKGHGIAFADLDNDGDQDIYAVMGGFYVTDVFQNSLFENPGNDNRWLTLRIEGVDSNRSAVGARVRVDVESPAGPRSVHLTVGTGGSFGSASLQQEIGLGRATAVRQVVITWPTTGKTQVIQRIPLDRVVEIREGNGTPRIQTYVPAALSPSRGRQRPPDSAKAATQHSFGRRGRDLDAGHQGDGHPLCQ